MIHCDVLPTTLRTKTKIIHEGYGDHRGMFPEMLSLINEAVSVELRNNQKDKTDGQMDR